MNVAIFWGMIKTVGVLSEIRTDHFPIRAMGHIVKVSTGLDAFCFIAVNVLLFDYLKLGYFLIE
jgi:hypothetical protein